MRLLGVVGGRKRQVGERCSGMYVAGVMVCCGEVVGGMPLRYRRQFGALVVCFFFAIGCLELSRAILP